MPNPNYVKGRKKEYKIIHELREQGYDIVQRTAGSHSPIDIIGINSHSKTILLIQAKPDTWTDKQVKKLEDEYCRLSGYYLVRFQVR